MNALVELQQAAFGTQNMTVDYRLAMMRVPEYDPQLDLLAVAPDGRLTAFCVGGVSAEENVQTGLNAGWLDPIGTRPEFQRQGLARALMLTGLSLLKARGMDRATMNMSAANIAMQKTAEAVGFAVEATIAWFEKQL